jgi:hypothetical protein
MFEKALEEIGDNTYLESNQKTLRMDPFAALLDDGYIENMDHCAEGARMEDIVNNLRTGGISSCDAKALTQIHVLVHFTATNKQDFGFFGNGDIICATQVELRRTDADYLESGIPRFADANRKVVDEWYVLVSADSQIDVYEFDFATLASQAAGYAFIVGVCKAGVVFIAMHLLPKSKDYSDLIRHVSDDFNPSKAKSSSSASCSDVETGTGGAERVGDDTEMRPDLDGATGEAAEPSLPGMACGDPGLGPVATPTRRVTIT